MSNGKILSIQSHVVHGYVGNRAAVFPLQVNYTFVNKTVILSLMPALHQLVLSLGFFKLNFRAND